MSDADRAAADDGGRPGHGESRLPRRLRNAAVLALLWRLGSLRRRRRHEKAQADGGQGGEQDSQERMLERTVGAPAWAERLVATLLALVALPAAGFVALFVLDPDTQLLGLTGALTLALLAGALVLASSRLVPQETKIEQRPRFDEAEQPRKVAQELAEGLQGITRRRMLLGAAGAAGAGVGAAAIIPVVALGPGLEDQLSRTPWRRGRRVVDDQGNPIAADEVALRSFVVGFPEGADKDNLGSPIAIVRVDPATLRLPSGRSHWAPRGILAYSKICTHASCAISLYRAPLSPSTQARGPALVCPCHYSTFDVLDGGSVEFGPAGRPLPQLPLSIDVDGNLRAAGPMSGPVGPSWFEDRQ